MEAMRMEATNQQNNADHANERFSLKDLFFVTTAKHGWQGRILGKIDRNAYLALLFDWFLGNPSCLKVISLEQMYSDEWGFEFYEDQEAWLEAGEIVANRREKAVCTNAVARKEADDQ